jgi:hypothetical protein
VTDSDPRGTCRVTLRQRRIRAACKIDGSLSTPISDAESIVLALGVPAMPLRYCAEFGGEEKRNDTLVMRRRRAPRPLRCPLTECPPLQFLPTAEVAGACWYPAPDTSCEEICGFVGLRYSEATRTFAGSDGTLANCAAVIGAFASSVVVVTDTECESLGISGVGCAVFTELGLSIRCTTPATTSAAAELDIARACACR